jgi:hypothetical protein
MKFNDDFLVTLNQRQRTYSEYVTSVQQNQMFKNAAIGYELFKDNDPDEAEKYKKMMSDIMKKGTNNDNWMNDDSSDLD